MGHVTEHTQRRGETRTWVHMYSVCALVRTCRMYVGCSLCEFALASEACVLPSAEAQGALLARCSQQASEGA